MEQGVFSPLLEGFLRSPLVCWVKTVSPLGSDGSPLSDFVTLLDGVYLNDIMTEINPNSSVQRAHRKVHNDPTLRIQNLSILVQQIKSCYQVSSALYLRFYQSSGSFVSLCSQSGIRYADAFSDPLLWLSVSIIACLDSVLH
ncbi:girdin-like [Sinocyclocheilus grahami]|uniref:girdin-like n=1 Tax=Sinocyclocheilus grahami TaxID=75366 RepID=UPI0007AD690E|nr:PREDICTED: girdin-like [Sinocyclocheilus grahami]